MPENIHTYTVSKDSNLLYRVIFEFPSCYGYIELSTILPSSFIGGPRNMLQDYQDAMQIVLKKGRPHIFLTMTPNTRCREIEIR